MTDTIRNRVLAAQQALARIQAELDGLEEKQATERATHLRTIFETLSEQKSNATRDIKARHAAELYTVKEKHRAALTSELYTLKERHKDEIRAAVGNPEQGRYQAQRELATKHKAEKQSLLEQHTLARREMVEAQEIYMQGLRK